MSDLLRVALAQIDPTVGDVPGNARKISEYTAVARERGAGLVVFPELAITGYPPEDLLLKTSFLDAAAAAVDELASQTRGIVAVVGFPEQAGDVYNAAAVLADGRVVAVYRKMYLPNYGVFDEQRYFQSGSEAVIFELNGIPVGLSICEDIWEPGPPAMAEALAGAQVLVNLSASPYRIGYGERRERMIVQRAVDYLASVVFVNTVGGQDELVFDGHSVAVDQAGRVLARCPQFQESLTLCTIDPAEVVAARLRDTRHRTNVRRQERAVRRSEAEPAVVRTGSVSVESHPERVGGELAGLLGPEEEVYAALRTGLRDYVDKNGFERVVLALSGGIDSALTALIAVDAVGADRVACVSMPSPYSSEGTRADARAIAANLGTEFHELGIQDAMDVYERLLAEPFAGGESGVSEENLQARIRGNVVMALSNRFGWLVLTTGNKSELSVGYATLYGDMAGGFSVLKDVFKGWVYRLVRWRNEQEGRELVPASVLDRPPSAELRADQLDEDSLPPYDVLDAILAGYVEEDLDAAGLVARGLPAEDVERVIAMVDRAEYKRRQAPPGIKISTKAFGRDRRLPITNRHQSTAHPPTERHLRALS
ncbi:MAG: NAD+ synthase [Thermoleophilaceae bacterium]|nr:NAD+ synthase [Thermoleophilaceae bacterium]